MRPSTMIKSGLGFFIGLFALIAVINTIGIIKVEGNEAVVYQDWKKGVLDEVKRDGTHFYFGWTTDVHKYNIGTQKITFDNAQSNPGAEYPRIPVNLGENGGQQAWVAVSANYRVGWVDDDKGLSFSPNKLVLLHKDGIGKTYEDVILKRTIVDVVNKIARPNEALNIYSGKGFVEFKEAIDYALKNHPVFKQRGIYIENTIVYKVHLDPAYEKEIAQKQLAVQQKLRKMEETKAAEEEARRVFAQSQAEVERRTQEAEAQKIERIKAAEAEKQEQVLMAEGKRDADLAKAVGIREIGTAEAEVAALKREALYAGESGAWRAKVEIATKQAEQLHGMLTGANVLTEKSVIMAGDMSGIRPTMALE